MAIGNCKALHGRISMPVLVLAASLTLAGCAGKMASLGSSDPFTTASTAPVSLKETAELGQRWRKNPTDVRLGLTYAARLKSLDQNAQQLEVLKTLVDGH